MDYHKKTAIVSGGSRGIGLAYVESLLSKGYSVAILDLSGASERSSSLTDRFGPGRVCDIECDVGNNASFRKSFDEACFFLLGDNVSTSCIDVLVLNAGIMGALFDKADAIVKVNLLGVIHGAEMCIKAATASLTRPAPKPLLIAITSSTNGIVPADSDFAPVYVATKFGINGFVYSMKPICKRFNIRINEIAPVAVRTPMVIEAGLSDEVRAFLDSENRGGVLEPEDLGKVLLHMIDDTSINGQVVTVHPSTLPNGRCEPLDPESHYDYLGIWSEDKSSAVASFVDGAITAVANKDINGWSGI